MPLATHRQANLVASPRSGLAEGSNPNRSLKRWIPCELTPRRQCPRIVDGWFDNDQQLLPLEVSQDLENGRKIESFDDHGVRVTGNRRSWS